MDTELDREQTTETPQTQQTTVDAGTRKALATMQQWEPIIQKAAARFRIAPEDIRAIIGAESNARADARADRKSAKAARGLMQVTADTWAGIQAKHADLRPYSFEACWAKPEINIMFGAATLADKRQILAGYGIDINGPSFAKLAVTAYNGGQEVVRLAYQHAEKAGSQHPDVDCFQLEHMSYAVEQTNIWKYYMPGHGGAKNNKSGTKDEAVRLKTREVMKYPDRVGAYQAAQGKTQEAPQQQPTTQTTTPQTTPDATPDGEGTVTVGVAELTPILPGHIIASSVGVGGRNHVHDVGVVQDALARHGHSPGTIDSKLGPTTIDAIKSFQRGFLKVPDGRVDVDGATERHLIGPVTTDATPTTETQSTPTTVQPQSESQTPEQPTPTAATQNGALRELMAKPRLTPEEIKRARQLIAAEPTTARGDLYDELQAKVIYFNQRENTSTGRLKDGSIGNLGDVMCNLTALAMCLEYLGVPNPHPEMSYPDALEKVRRDKLPRAARTTEAGWGGVATALGVPHTALGGGKRARSFWAGTVQAALRGGKSVMCSIEDHIVRIQDITDEGVVADDPFGRSKLLPGKTQRNSPKGALTSHAWLGSNHKAGRNDGKQSNVGEDITWPWAEVETHHFLWIAAFGR